MITKTFKLDRKIIFIIVAIIFVVLLFILINGNTGNEKSAIKEVENRVEYEIVHLFENYTVKDINHLNTEVYVDEDYDSKIFRITGALDFSILQGNKWEPVDYYWYDYTIAYRNGEWILLNNDLYDG